MSRKSVQRQIHFHCIERHWHYSDIHTHFIYFYFFRKSWIETPVCIITHTHALSFHRCLLQLGTSTNVLQDRAIVTLLANGYWRAHLVSLATFQQLEIALLCRPPENESLPRGRLSQGRSKLGCFPCAECRCVFLPPSIAVNDSLKQHAERSSQGSTGCFFFPPRARGILNVCVCKHSIPSHVTGLCGGSASGKTTVARKIIEALDVPWVVLLSMDSFYKVCTSLAAFQLPLELNQNLNVAIKKGKHGGAVLQIDDLRVDGSNSGSNCPHIEVSFGKTMNSLISSNRMAAATHCWMNVRVNGWMRANKLSPFLYLNLEKSLNYVKNI